MKHIIVKTGAIALCSAFLSTAAPADPLVDGVVNQLVSQGYSRINVRKSPSQITFVSTLNGVQRVLVVDRRTGALISDQQGVAAAGQSTSNGTTLSRDGDSGWGGDGNQGGGNQGGGFGGGNTGGKDDSSDDGDDDDDDDSGDDSSGGNDDDGDDDD